MKISQEPFLKRQKNVGKTRDAYRYTAKRKENDQSEKSFIGSSTFCL